MKEHEILSINFIKFIPDQNNDSFLKPVVGQILELVKTMGGAVACVRCPSSIAS
jgi:hypothetical protein